MIKNFLKRFKSKEVKGKEIVFNYATTLELKPKSKYVIFIPAEGLSKDECRKLVNEFKNRGIDMLTVLMRHTEKIRIIEQPTK